MAPEELTARIAAEPRRGPCTDAERRAARTVERALRAAGREAELEPVWVRPRWAAALVVHAALGVAASLLAATAPVAAAIALALVSVSLVVEVSGRGTLLSRVWPRRASQNVVALDPVERPFRLLVTAHLDSGPGGLAYRAGPRRLAARAQRLAGGLLPGPFGWTVAALVLLLACAAARAGGEDGAALGVLQLLPTLVLLLAGAAALDVATSAPGPGAGEAAAVTAAVALTRLADGAGLRALSVDLVVAGAGEGSALGLRAHLRRRRHELDPARVAVLELAPGSTGHVGWWTHDGPLLAGVAHPQLRRLAAQVAADEPHLGAAAWRSRRRGASHAARRHRLPALAVGCLDATGIAPRARSAGDTVEELDEAAGRDLLDFCLALVLALDEELARAP